MQELLSQSLGKLAHKEATQMQEKGQSEGKGKAAAGSQQSRQPNQAPQRPGTPAAAAAQPSAQGQNTGKAAVKASKAGRASSRKGQTSEMFAHLPQYKVHF